MLSICPLVRAVRPSRNRNRSVASLELTHDHRPYMPTSTSHANDYTPINPDADISKSQTWDFRLLTTKVCVAVVYINTGRAQHASQGRGHSSRRGMGCHRTCTDSVTDRLLENPVRGASLGHAASWDVDCALGRACTTGTFTLHWTDHQIVQTASTQHHSLYC